MTINNRIILQEVAELKKILSEGGAEIPSFWACLWPGLVMVAWNTLCAIISVDNDYLSSKYIFRVMIFPVGVSFMILLGVASARSLFLSVPRSFRVNSNAYHFVNRKITAYAFIYMLVNLLLACFNRVFYGAPFPFAFMTILATVFFVIVMNLDFGRYQLTALTSLLQSIKPSTEK